MAERLSNLAIFVGGLISSVTEQNLLNIFKEQGEITKVKIIKDKKGNWSKGYAFVQVANQTTLQAILNKEYYFGGRKLNISKTNDISVKEDQLKRQMFHKICITNLPSEINDEDIKAYFSKFGEVRYAYVI